MTTDEPRGTELLEQRLRELGRAVADRTIVEPRAEDDIPTIAVATKAEPSRRRPPLLAAAAIIVLVLITTALVLARRDDTGVTTSSSSSTTIVDDDSNRVPRLAPLQLPNGFVLDAAAVRPGAPPTPDFVRRYQSIGEEGAQDLTIRVKPPRAGQSAFAPGPETVDVNGSVAVLDPGAGQPGSRQSISWVLPDGALVRFTSDSDAMRDSLVTFARFVRVDTDSSTPTAKLENVPTGFVEVYAGPDYLETATTDGAGATLAYVPPTSTGTIVMAPLPEQSIFITQYSVPRFDSRAWLASTEGRASRRVGDLTFVTVQDAGPNNESQLVGARDDAIIVVNAAGVTQADAEAMIRSLRVVEGDSWTKLLGSAQSAPIPRPSRDGSTTLCEGLDQIAKDFSPAQPTWPDGTGFRALADRVTGDQATQLRTLADFLDRYKPDPTVALAEEEGKTVDDAGSALRRWYRANCLPATAVSSPADRLLVLPPTTVIGVARVR